jgi:hypothetical protein
MSQVGEPGISQVVGDLKSLNYIENCDPNPSVLVRILVRNWVS